MHARHRISILPRPREDTGGFVYVGSDDAGRQPLSPTTTVASTEAWSPVSYHSTPTPSVEPSRAGSPSGWSLVSPPRVSSRRNPGVPGWPPMQRSLSPETPKYGGGLQNVPLSSQGPYFPYDPAEPHIGQSAWTPAPTTSAGRFRAFTIDAREFSVGRQVGFGGSCDIFLGYHPQYGRVAVKRPRASEDSIQSDAIRRFEREAKIWQEASRCHPTILPFFGIIRRHDQVYLLSPWMEGGTLRDSLKDTHSIDKFEMLDIVASALASLHAIGVVHGDINARNILLDHNKKPMICDFGLAKIIADTMNTSISTKGSGSTRWMAPELFGDASKDARSDVYAFGMTIVEVLSGQPPYPHIHDAEKVMYCIISGAEQPMKKPSHSLAGESYAEIWSLSEECRSLVPRRRPTMKEVCKVLHKISKRRRRRMAA